MAYVGNYVSVIIMSHWLSRILSQRRIKGTGYKSKPLIEPTRGIQILYIYLDGLNVLFWHEI